MIEPFDRSQWERVYRAFLEYLSRHREFSRNHRQLASEQLASIQEAIQADAIEFKSLNPHLVNSAYTKTRIQLMNPDNRQLKVLDLSHYVTGMPIQWRYSKPLVA